MSKPIAEVSPLEEAIVPEALRSTEPVEVSSKARKKCKCGHDQTNPLVSASGEYTFGGWCLILFGISAKPTAIRYQCRRCDQIVARTTDPAVIAQTRLWG